MLCRRLHKLCKQFAILQNGLEIKKLGGMFSSLTLFIVDISLNHVLPPLPEVSSFWSWRPHQQLLSAQSSFSLTSLGRAILLGAIRSSISIFIRQMAAP